MKARHFQWVMPICLLAAVSAPAQSTNEFPELLPPYAELPPTFWEQYGLLLLLALLACTALVSATVWMIRLPKPIPALPPEVQARHALEALRAQPEDGALLSQVSQILRRYVSAAFGLPPGELTTQELITAMESGQAPDRHLRQAVSEFLERCDARKFTPTRTTSAQDSVAAALALVEQGESIRAARTAAPGKSSA